MTIDEIIDNFSLLDDWDDRYRYVIELGRGLAPLDEWDRNQAGKVRAAQAKFGWRRAILFAIYSGKRAREILATDAITLFERMGLREHLTPQRSNGFRSMVERIKSDARTAMAVVA
jgi:cysteine desulfuration protein SufE